MAWLPDDFSHPTLLSLPDGHHYRPIRPSDTDMDYAAVMGSRESLWELFGEAWGWPPDHLTYEDDHEELVRHANEIEAHESFNYALLDADETALLGCLYIDPPERIGADAEISWWVVDSVAGTDLAAALETVIPAWISDEWPFERPRYIGRDLTWAEWLGLPESGSP